MGSMYGAYMIYICSKLQTRPHLREFIFIYILLFDFSARMFRYHSNRHCALSMPQGTQGIEYNPGLGLLLLGIVKI